MGTTATKAREAHSKAKSKPKNNRSVQHQKIQSARITGVLALSESKLKTIPPEILELSTLRTLDLSSNTLSELPCAMNSLTSLKILKVSFNVLVTLPNLSKLEALTSLVLDGNILKDIPHALPPNLTKLSLKGNDLRTIPQRVIALGQLQELDLSDNGMVTLPETMDQMQELEEINLDGNKLTTLPAVFGRCNKLKILSARRNLLAGDVLIQSIAAEVLGEGSAVQVLNLDGNSISKEHLQRMKGFDAFLTRRTKLKNKEVHGGLNSDLSLCGLD